MFAVPAQPVFFGNIAGIKTTAPTVICPAGSADPEVVHPPARPVKVEWRSITVLLMLLAAMDFSLAIGVVRMLSIGFGQLAAVLMCCPAPSGLIPLDFYGS